MNQQDALFSINGHTAYELEKTESLVRLPKRYCNTSTEAHFVLPFIATKFPNYS